VPGQLNWLIAKAAEDDDDIDLFGDDDEVDEEAERIKAERVAAYAAKKANKPKTIAKSVVTLDVKPWDDETDMAKLEEAVRSITQEGLLWGASTLVAIGFGIKKLQINMVIGEWYGVEVGLSIDYYFYCAEDELVSLDELQEKIAEFEDYVQSTDVAAMQSTYMSAIRWHCSNVALNRTLEARLANLRVMLNSTTPCNTVSLKDINILNMQTK
jgi:elongation factor 1-beta